ncbi:MAG: hypothetical protein WBV82_05465 [Myxococcaceae bacterium]
MRASLLVLLLASAPALAAGYTVPIDVGIGPAAYVISGPVFADQPIHFGLKINVEAVIDQEWIRKNPRAVPKQYRRMANKITEARMSHFLVPDSFFISPKVKNTGIYGVTWRPLGLNQSFGEGGAKFRLGAGLLLTYAFIHSDSEFVPTTHFIRPGLDLMAELEFIAAKTFGVSFGWASGFYIPQQLGTLGIGPIDESVWHVGQAFLKVHFRFPYEVRR